MSAGKANRAKPTFGEIGFARDVALGLTPIY